jgi:hypothetical protein
LIVWIYCGAQYNAPIERDILCLAVESVVRRSLMIRKGL